MPRQSTNAKKTTSGPTSKVKKQSLLGRLRRGRYALPTIFVLSFMVIGGVGLSLALAATTTYSLWGNSIPKTLAVSDGASVELGVKFKATVAGYVTGVRFYKSAQNTGVHTGSLWDSQGKLLATVKFSNETSSGWQSAMFAEPVSVASNVTYTISYHAPNGHYSKNTNYLSVTRSRKNLVAPKNTAASPNGVFAVTSTPSTFPTQSGNGANYWVDVLFNTKLLGAQSAPAAPAGLSASVQNASVTLGWQASAGSSTIAKYTVYRGGSKLADVGTALAYTDITTQAGGSYSYQVQATDSNNLTSPLSAPVSVTIPSAPIPSGGGTSGGATTTCPLPKYPDATCTGIPAGTTLVALSGDQTFDTAGQIIDSKDIHGCVTVTATNVTIKNSRITCSGGFYGLVDNGHSGLVIQDTEIDCGGTGATGVSGNGFTLTRVNLHGCENGLDIDGNVTVQDSYIHDLFNGPTTHTDGAQINQGAGNITFSHNTIAVNLADNSAIIMYDDTGSQNHDVLVTNNRLSGGGYTLYCPRQNTVNIQVTNNRFGPSTYSYADSCTAGHATWLNNVSDTSGAVLTAE